jgi:uncharacterized protein (DUF983 family)
MTKRCPRCGETKDVDQFGIHRQTKSRLNSNCRQCRAEIGRAYRRDPAVLLRRLARLMGGDE